MNCPNCQFENREGAEFCGKCGTKNQAENNFYDECGSKLSLPLEQVPSQISFNEKLTKIQKYLPKGLTEKILSQKERIEGERKQVTVMFCDMEGFTHFDVSLELLSIKNSGIEKIPISSEESLKYLLECISGARIFLVFTYRPEFVYSWGGRSYHSQVTLNRLSNHESLAMVTHLLDTEEIEKDLEELILEKTEGIPFFIEEFKRSLKDLVEINQK